MATQTFISGNGVAAETLVVVFLRGAADGLSLVAPVEDDDYHRARPRLGISKKEGVKLDGVFALNPLLKDLAPIYQNGDLAIVHAAGSEDSTRSHFEAQDLMEHGGLAAGGWLGRFLRYRSRPSGGALSAVALGSELPECLRGAPSATVLQSIDDFSLGAGSKPLRKELARLYGLKQDDLGGAAKDTLHALDRIEKLRKTAYHPESGADYGKDGFSVSLMQVARLIKAQVGLEAASVDLGGWDSHFTQGTIIDPLMSRLAKGLAAFYRDMGSAMAHTTVVIMTEFGRRVQENASFGTDHGRGSVMFAMGGGVKGGRVLGGWQGLKRELLEGPGDLPVRNNYRNVLAPILQKLGAAEAMAQVFPEFNLEPLAIYG
jgi:uncharacterized protein (DUF1501 family)